MFSIAALYQFTPLPDPALWRDRLEAACAQRNLIGLLLVAKEGVNGTLAGPREDLASLREFLLAHEEFHTDRLSWKWSTAEEAPYRDLRVKRKPEIVTLRVPGLDPSAHAGTYVAPKDWNALIADPEVVLVDTRNDYEACLGTFENAVNPRTANFSEFPQWVERNLDAAKHKKVAMFCTGGIRCEKSTALLRARGFDEVFHLQGGILKYLEEIPEAQSKWRGECFVFDTRVAVTHGLKEGEAQICGGCGHPVAKEDQAQAAWTLHARCEKCAGKRMNG